MRTIKGTFTLGIGYSNANHEDEFEIIVENNTTDEEIDQILQEDWQDWSSNFIDGGWDIESDEITI